MLHFLGEPTKNKHPNGCVGMMTARKLVLQTSNSQRKQMQVHNKTLYMYINSIVS